MGPTLMEVPSEGIWTLSLHWAAEGKDLRKGQWKQAVSPVWRLRWTASLSALHLASINLRTPDPSG